VLSAANSDERNGELSYQTAYDSFMEGKFNGGNRVEKVSNGRWITKITTPDGIVLYKDAAQNVAIQSPDGKWHITDARGQYAATTRELETRDQAKEKLAKAKTPAAGGKKAQLAKASKKSRKASVAKKSEGKGRKLASVEAPASEADAGLEIPAPEANETARAAQAEPKTAVSGQVKAADPKPAEAKAVEAKATEAKATEAKASEAAKADAGKASGGDQLLPMDQLAKLADASRAPAAASEAKVAETKGAEAPKPAAEAVKPAAEPAKPAAK